MPHLIHDLNNELPPIERTDRDWYAEELLTPRHILTTKLRAMLRISELELEVKTLKAVVWALALAQLVLMVVLAFTLKW